MKLVATIDLYYAIFFEQFLMQFAFSMFSSIGSFGIWLAKSCKIQQLAQSFSTTYIYVQQDILLLNYFWLKLNNYFC